MKKNENPASSQPNNPLHGVKLKEMLKQMEEHYGWEMMGKKVDIKCFTSNPSMGSSLKFLRKTPWAREKVEHLYLDLVFQGIIKQGENK